MSEEPIAARSPLSCECEQAEQRNAVTLDGTPRQEGSVLTLDGGAPEQAEMDRRGRVQREFSLSSSGCRILIARCSVEQPHRETK